MEAQTSTSKADGLDFSLMFIAFIVFLDMTGIGLILPVLPDLITGLSGASIDQAAVIGGWLLFVFALMQFICAPIIGGLSDRFGRRPILLFTLAALGLDYALMAWAPTLTWLFVGRIISGIMGATFAAANSAVADTSTSENRGRNFGIVGAAGALGFVMGPAIGAFIGQFGERVPFIVASVLALSGACVGLFVLKETLPKEKRRAFSVLRANPFGTIIQMYKIPAVFGLLCVLFISQLAGQSQVAVWAYYGIEKFNWSILEIGLSVTLFGVLLAIVQGGLTGKAIARFGEIRTGLVSLMFGIPSYLCFAFAHASWMMIVGIFIGALSGFYFPAIQSMMSARIGEDAQGELQGAVASMLSIASIFGPIIMAGAFGMYSDDIGLYFPGAPYLIAATLLAVAIALYIKVTNSIKRDQN